MAVVVKKRICRQCGKEFQGGPRAWYCPDCRAIRQREAHIRFQRKGKVADRPLGSVDRCLRCGKEYIVNSSRQKYCPKCALDAVREADRLSSRKWNQDHKDTLYPQKNAARNMQRKKNPEEVRRKEREYWAKNKDKKSAKNKREAEKRRNKKMEEEEPAK